jgi:hypothetical protein
MKTGRGDSPPLLGVYMPKMKFIGQYTNGRKTITYLEQEFTGREPLSVTPELFEMLKDHPEFVVVDPLDHDGDGERGGSLPDNPPGLTNKPKSELLEIAAAEGVEADDEMTNAAIRKAIEEHREAGNG